MNGAGLQKKKRATTSAAVPWKIVICAWKNPIWAWKNREFPKRVTWLFCSCLILQLDSLEFAKARKSNIWLWLGARPLVATMAKSLKDLPFQIEELTWDRLSEVQNCLKLPKAEAFTVLCHVLGAPPKPLSSAAASGLRLIHPGKFACTLHID